MELDKIATKPISRPSLICNICGDVARGFNFDVITCLSCKAFFRRNAFRLSKIRRCSHTNSCNITKETRSYCSACRLKKCYTFGMNPKLIRLIVQHETNCNIYKQLIMAKQKQIQLPTPKPLGLLENDRSTLTYDQWNLLSNIILSYNEQNVINQVKHILEEKSSLPVKLRLKSSDTINLMSKPFENIILLINHSPHFRCLSSNAHRAVSLHNVFFTGALDGYFVARETDLFTNLNYMIASGAIYGHDYVMKCAQNNERLEPNGDLIKIMLFVLIFSSNFSMVIFNDQEDFNTMSSSIELIHIQDIYVTVLWKYLIYLYGYKQAVVRFSRLLKTVLDMLSRVEELSKNVTLHKMINRIVTHTERALVIQE
ncbi:unnamed protein product [Rotaria sp. Silwood1]|nr:unnamed protein product [Rotaria sp. Silwood1]CAF0939810.1 unnamed protein product [Rotaria sp. Silwood1]CAF3373862.1 unnamed protein product [Rotaria sp. Silwood1]CAF3381985.1 unnamed protein product [Rotaria sp. Silwood1]CAF3393754.1 unnamed protein product [Rotaria sp. Silwood1]